jgi:arginine/ornithine transport system substrate-binding protein
MTRPALPRRALLAALLAAALPAAAQAPLPATVRLGVEGAYPPFSEIGTDGKIKGFDIDIGNALCERMKVRCVQVQLEFDAMIPALRAKKIDAVLASMSITPERLKAVDFTDRYYRTPSRMVVKAGAPFEITPEGLEGRRVGVQRNTIQDRFATATFKGAEIVRYGKGDETFLDLRSGRVDAVLADMVNADLGFLKTPAGAGFAFKGPSYDDPAFFGSGAGIALRKGDTALRDAMNAALAAIRADGTYQQIADRYFGFDIYGSTKK